MTTKRQVTVIPQRINPLTHLATNSPAKRRTAGYARVSTASDEQFTSYEAQVDYYTQYIKSNPEWEFVKVYTDEGISGVMTKHRDGFNEMIEDALNGKIDLIVTKSVSRFARNTVDSLVTVRKLKEKGVEVYFEKENIYTLDSKGELLITIMSSLAQEESRSISENVTWGWRKRFADGKVSLPYKRFLGYEKGDDDLPEVVEEQAVTVRLIYSLFLSGKTTSAIAKILTEKAIPTPSGELKKWSPTTIDHILTNEKYKGAALLQKGFTVDFLTKKKQVNRGEVPQYYVEHSHEAIISPEMFDLVQAEFARRRQFGKKYSGCSPFSAKIVCADCGEFFGPKVMHSNDKYRRVKWRCNHKYDGERFCQTPCVDEEAVKDGFVRAYNSLIADREPLLEDCRLMLEALTDCADIDTEIANLTEELEVVTELSRRCVEENARSALNQTEYAAKYDALERRFNEASDKLNALGLEKERKKTQADRIGEFMFLLREREEAIPEFDEKLWTASVDRVTVARDGGMAFTFRNGVTVNA